MNRKHWSVMVVTIVMVIGLTACGDGDSASPTTVASPSGDQSGDTVPESGDDPSPGSGEPSGGLPGPTADGSFTIDGEAFDARVHRCEVFSAGQDPNPDDLNVLAYLGGSEGLELEVGHTSRPGGDGIYEATVVFVFYSRSGGAAGIEQFEGDAATGPDGQWYSQDDFEFANPLPAPVLTVDGSHITGSIDGVEQEYPEGDATVDVTFDLEIPDEITEGC